MTGSDISIEREALGWLTRINDPAFADWESWETWIAADPRHAENYWRLAEREADMIESLAGRPERAATPRPTSPASVWPRRVLLTGAAGVVLAVGAGVAWTQRPQPIEILTAPGQHRQVVLADGSLAWLDGETRLSFDRRRPRLVRLDAGRARFEIVHDEDRLFTVEVGSATVTDLGTVFDVTRLQDGARVSVSEGQARVDVGAASAILSPGDGAMTTSGGIERRAAPLESAGDWMRGRLTYDDETLAVVAEDLSRGLARPVSVAPEVAGRRFSGSLGLTAPIGVLKGRLEALLGVKVVETDGGWRLEPRPAA